MAQFDNKYWEIYQYLKYYQKILFKNYTQWQVFFVPFCLYNKCVISWKNCGTLFLSDFLIMTAISCKSCRKNPILLITLRCFEHLYMERDIKKQTIFGVFKGEYDILSCTSLPYAGLRWSVRHMPVCHIRQFAMCQFAIG